MKKKTHESYKKKKMRLRIILMEEEEEEKVILVEEDKTLTLRNTKQQSCYKCYFLRFLIAIELYFCT